jgi:hypothetical protein
LKPFRKHVAIAIDGGGIRGVIPARALMVLEQALGKSSHELFRLAAGTSTGSIVAAGIASGLNAGQVFSLYESLGASIFRKSWRSRLWLASRYRYPSQPLEQALKDNLGEMTLGEVWEGEPRSDLVVTTFDLIHNRTRFIKPWKPEFAAWPVVKAVLASAAAPTYFPVVDGRFVDGGVGSYGNPCYLAAYEIKFVLKWPLEETTLISLGTGRFDDGLKYGEAERFLPPQWIAPLLDGFLHSADDQQVHLVSSLFEGLDFRRFQVDLEHPIGMDDPRALPELAKYGEMMGYRILNDKVDRAQRIAPSRPRIPPHGSAGTQKLK